MPEEELALTVVGGPTPQQVEQEAAVLAEAEAPVLAFCRSGTRSIVTWSLIQAQSGERSRGDGKDVAIVVVDGQDSLAQKVASRLIVHVHVHAHALARAR